jgi:photosystem II stability/assembly factor-like uncharacterized protein
MTDDDLDDLLRGHSEPLQPPAGSWESVRRRARRRKAAKLAGAVLATAVIVGGGVVPTVLIHNTHTNEQRLTVAAVPTTASPATPVDTVHTDAGLPGFQPRSVSFVSQTVGFMLGSDAGSAATIVKTVDGGSTWTVLAQLPGVTGSEGIRFATGEIGFVFGALTYLTTDGGLSWSPQPSPGYIGDLETVNGHTIYALGSACATCQPVSVYRATTTAVGLKRIRHVPSLTGDVSLSVNNTAVYVLVTAPRRTGTIWYTPNGTTWSSTPSPCRLTTGAVSQWGTNGVTVACAAASDGHGKQVFVSVDGGVSFTPVPTRPAAAGTVTSMSATSADNIIIATPDGFEVTTDGGSDWALRGPALTGGAGFVGFISLTHVVALPADPTTDPYFMTSDDAGRTWTTTRFPK